MGFEPTKAPIEISKFLINLRPCVPCRPPLSPNLAVDLAVGLNQRVCAVHVALGSRPLFRTPAALPVLTGGLRLDRTAARTPEFANLLHPPT